MSQWTTFSTWTRPGVRELWAHCYVLLLTLHNHVSLNDNLANFKQKKTLSNIVITVTFHSQLHRTFTWLQTALKSYKIEYARPINYEIHNNYVIAQRYEVAVPAKGTACSV